MPKCKIYYRVHAQRLRVARIVLGITEQQAADGFGVSLKTYRKYEAGSPQRGCSKLINFAKKYNVSLNWLLEGGVPAFALHDTPLNGRDPRKTKQHRIRLRQLGLSERKAAAWYARPVGFQPPE